MSAAKDGYNIHKTGGHNFVATKLSKLTVNVSLICLVGKETVKDVVGMYAFQIINNTSSSIEISN